ncbi:MAG: asparagine synthase (glutamine-hydrolyzing) [Polyangiaceae bacterium]|nr:asparagine synthase (glutamine-hydrolyzing) [Polyangiaceae bacterium]
MCGIAGLLEPEGRRADRELLLSMAAEIRHRGPSGTGLYMDGRFGMVNTRLAIVDLVGGDQPISNESGELWVMQNGEIYNHIELRQELTTLGHRFQTACDTEVIVHAYEQWGRRCLDRFNGPFALAVFDRTRGELLLARDRLGIRPLFLAEARGVFLFGSEAKAILRHPAMQRALDPVGIAECFVHWGAAFDRSAFRGIRELAPGHYLKLGPAGTEERRWWDLPFRPGLHDQGRGEGDFAGELRSLLEDSVRLRLRADVPVGVYLSGGLDSSATTALVRRFNRKSVRSFAVRFDDPLFDEGRYQALAAAELNTELTTVTVSAGAIAAALPEVVRLGERPLLRTAPAPLLHLSKHVHDSGFRVVLTGEGADEVFAGYDIFREAKVRRFWARQPESKCRPLLLGRLHPYLAQNLSRAAAFTTAFFRGNLTDVDDPLYSHRIRYTNGERILGLLSSELLDELPRRDVLEQRLLSTLPHDFLGLSPLNRAQWLEITTFMQGYLLHAQGDRMLMGHAVEGRFPYLDHRLIELASRVPDRLLLRGLREKALLVKAVQDVIPREIAERRKQPYRAPILHALVGSDAPESVTSCLQPEALKRVGVFDVPRSQRIIDKCRRSVNRRVAETDEMALVAMVSTVLLHRQLVEAPTLALPLVPTREVHGSMTLEPSRGVHA